MDPAPTSLRLLEVQVQVAAEPEFQLLVLVLAVAALVEMVLTSIWELVLQVLDVLEG